MQGDTELGCDDAGERGLAQPRRAGEQQMVDSLLPPTGSLEDDAEMLLELALSDELLEMARAQTPLLADEITADVVAAAPSVFGSTTDAARRAGSRTSAKRGFRPGGDVFGRGFRGEQFVAHQSANRCRASRSSSDVSVPTGRSRTASTISSLP